MWPVSEASMQHDPGVAEALAALPDGVIAVVKRDCPTCVMVAPVLHELADAGVLAAVVSQDDPAFSSDLHLGVGVGLVDDRELDTSFALDIDTVPTLLTWKGGGEVERTVGWSRERWGALTGVAGLGADLPDMRPGCGSRTHDPDIAEQHAIARVVPKLRSRRFDMGAGEDEMEALFARGFTDGLPVVPPTP